MSLTQDIAGLTQSVDELTEEVSGKMDQIDRELVKFQNSFQPTLKKSLRKTYYFDGQSGDDDNDGSEDKPFRTLQALAGGNRMVEGTCYNLVISGTVELSGDIVFSNNIVFIIKNPNVDTAKIEQKVTGQQDKEGTTYATAASICLRQSFIHFHYVDIDTVKSSNLPVLSRDTFIARDDYGLGHVSIFGDPTNESYRVKVTINEGTFCGLASGPDLKNFTFYGLNCIKNGTGYLLDVAESVCAIKLNTSIFPEGLTCRDFINGIQYSNGYATNIMTSNQNLLNEQTVS